MPTLQLGLTELCDCGSHPCPCCIRDAPASDGCLNICCRKAADGAWNKVNRRCLGELTSVRGPAKPAHCATASTVVNVALVASSGSMVKADSLRKWKVNLSEPSWTVHPVGPEAENFPQKAKHHQQPQMDDRPSSKMRIWLPEHQRGRHAMDRVSKVAPVNGTMSQNDTQWGK